MSEALASHVVAALTIYLGCGAVFAAVFACYGVQQVDPAARQCTTGFRLIIVPGATALWPLLGARWVRRSADPPRERTAHRRVAARGAS